MNTKSCRFFRRQRQGRYRHEFEIFLVGRQRLGISIYWYYLNGIVSSNSQAKRGYRRLLAFFKTRHLISRQRHGIGIY